MIDAFLNKRTDDPMTKQSDSRATALAGMNKTELIRTIKALDKRQTKLLNELAEQNRRVAEFHAMALNDGRDVPEQEPAEIEKQDQQKEHDNKPWFPWEQK